MVQGGIHYQSGEWPSFGFRLNWQAPGCPTFRDSRKVGTADLDPMFIRHSQTPGFMLHPIHAQPAPSRGGILSLHHHQLLPAPAIARQPTLSRPVLERAGAGAAALPFYCNRIRHHARARPPAAHRARARQSLRRHAGYQAGIRPALAFALAATETMRNNFRCGAARSNAATSGRLASTTSSSSPRRSASRSCATFTAIG